MISQQLLLLPPPPPPSSRRQQTTKRLREDRELEEALTCNKGATAPTSDTALVPVRVRDDLISPALLQDAAVSGGLRNAPSFSESVSLHARPTGWRNLTKSTVTRTGTKTQPQIPERDSPNGPAAAFAVARLVASLVPWASSRLPSNNYPSPHAPEAPLAKG
jgi:hypothetical protein